MEEKDILDEISKETIRNINSEEKHRFKRFSGTVVFIQIKLPKKNSSNTFDGKRRSIFKLRMIICSN